MLSTGLAKHAAGHAIMAEMGKAELAVDIAPHAAMAPLRTLRWTRTAAAEVTASQVCAVPAMLLRSLTQTGAMSVCQDSPSCFLLVWRPHTYVYTPCLPAV